MVVDVEKRKKKDERKTNYLVPYNQFGSKIRSDFAADCCFVAVVVGSERPAVFVFCPSRLAFSHFFFLVLPP